MSLLTKIQLKDYEPGEFSESKQRTYQETLDLIEHFPWSGQRDHITIGPTNPSVTIEGASGDFLKLATYYNDKFVLYYLDDNNHLYTYPVSTLAEAYPILQTFFDQRFTTDGFKRQPTPFVNNKVHFETKHFNYTMVLGPTLMGISFASVFALAGLSIGIVSAIKHGLPGPLPARLLICALGLFIIFIYTYLIAIFINHYRASRGKFLSISRGNPVFRFGPLNAPATYNKKDIQEVVLYGANSNKGLDGLRRTEIIFNDGSSINISGLLLSTYPMSQKFPRELVRYNTRSYPFIPLSASIPS